MEQLKIYLDSRGIGGGELTEARVNEMIKKTAGVFVANVETKLDKLIKAFEKYGGFRNSRLRIDELPEVLGQPLDCENDDVELYPLQMAER
eukprot:scaffold6069_cov63-Attheya_sp.AAC.4